MDFDETYNINTKFKLFSIKKIGSAERVFMPFQRGLFYTVT